MYDQKRCKWVRAFAGLAFGLAVGGSHFLGAQTPPELSRYVAQLHEESPQLREAAVQEILWLLRRTKITAPDVARLLKYPENHVRDGALRVIGDAGSDANDALPVLIKLLKDPDEEVRRYAIYALGAIGKNRDASRLLGDAAPIVVELLKDPDRFVRQAAARILGGSFGSVTKEVITPRLVELIEDADDDVRLNAVKALGGCGAETKDAAPILVGYLEDSDRSMRRAAAVALGRIRPEPPDAVPRLVELLRTDPAEDVRRSAAEALRRIWPALEDPIPQLLERLKDDDKGVRRVAIEALGRVHKDAQAAIPALTALLGDPDPVTRESAEDAIGYIAAGSLDAYEPDETTRRSLEKVREILDTQGEHPGRDSNPRGFIESAISRLEQCERASQIKQTRLRGSRSESWKSWSVVVPAAGLLVLVAVFVVRRRRGSR